jgi:DNA excision repair protein ERCC-1
MFSLFSILCEMTLMLAWNEVEAGRILETYKLYENKPPDMIMEKTGTRVQDFTFSLS